MRTINNNKMRPVTGDHIRTFERSSFWWWWWSSTVVTVAPSMVIIIILVGLMPPEVTAVPKHGLTPPSPPTFIPDTSSSSTTRTPKVVTPSNPATSSNHPPDNGNNTPKVDQPAIKTCWLTGNERYAIKDASKEVLDSCAALFACDCISKIPTCHKLSVNDTSHLPDNCTCIPKQPSGGNGSSARWTTQKCDQLADRSWLARNTWFWIVLVAVLICMAIAGAIVWLCCRKFGAAPQKKKDHKGHSGSKAKGSSAHGGGRSSGGRASKLRSSKMSSSRPKLRTNMATSRPMQPSRQSTARSSRGATRASNTRNSASRGASRGGTSRGGTSRGGTSRGGGTRASTTRASASRGASKQYTVTATSRGQSRSSGARSRRPIASKLPPRPQSWRAGKRSSTGRSQRLTRSGLVKAVA